MRAVLDRYFDSYNPVVVQPAGLGITTCCFEDDPKRLLIGLMNHDLFADWQGTLRLRIGDVASVRAVYGGQTLTARGPLELKISAGDVLVLDIRMR